MKECVYLQQQLSSLVASSNSTAAEVYTSASMPCWYFDKKDLRDTPSLCDGIAFETERRYRKEGARFIMSCGTQMGLGHNTMATGVVYFHRFYMFHSFKSFPRYVTACCCLFLAGKVEETPKKCRDIIKIARSLLSDNYFVSFGEDPKEEVMTLERILLKTIKFDLQVDHPYTFLLKYAKCIKGDQQKLQKMVQMAWNFVNDSLSTVVCLQWEPEIIAVALIHLASKLSKFTVVDWVGRQPHHLRWWDMFVSDVTMEIIENICHQVLDLYQSSHKDPADMPPSPPQKPPSRADSPTPQSKEPAVAGSTTGAAGSPTRRLKPSTIMNSTTTTAVASATVPAPIASTSAAAALNSSSNSHGEINNIQAIKSLANSTMTTAIALRDPDDIPSSSGYASGYMYPPPPPTTNPLHSFNAPVPGLAPATAPPPAVHGYVGPGVGGGGPAPPPPLPPPPPYGAPPNSTWSSHSSHYVSGPPPMPPPSRPPMRTLLPAPQRTLPPPPPQQPGGYYHSQSYGGRQRY